METKVKNGDKSQVCVLPGKAKRIRHNLWAQCEIPIMRFYVSAFFNLIPFEKESSDTPKKVGP